jgi:rhodanese-related sulfurtransferase
MGRKENGKQIFGEKNMKKFFSSLSLEKKLAILAFTLGIFALFAGSPYPGTTIKVNSKDLSLISVNDIEKVKPEDLANDIIQSKSDYRLIDLRKPDEFQKYNIPTSENIQVNQLLNSDLTRNEKILLYSDSDIVSAQAWFLLKANHFKGVNILAGELNGWRNNILFPSYSLGVNPTKEQIHKFDKLNEVSKYFGGSVQTNSSFEKNNNLYMPELKAPATVILKKVSGKKKREGC